ncbi:MAG: hypothetical protein ACK56F_03030, partial [bacterium]
MESIMLTDGKGDPLSRSLKSLLHFWKIVDRLEDGDDELIIVPSLITVPASTVMDREAEVVLTRLDERSFVVRSGEKSVSAVVRRDMDWESLTVVLLSSLEVAEGSSTVESIMLT